MTAHGSRLSTAMAGPPMTATLSRDFASHVEDERETLLAQRIQIINASIFEVGLQLSPAASLRFLVDGPYPSQGIARNWVHMCFSVS
jgi:hypothetical protein